MSRRSSCARSTLTSRTPDATDRLDLRARHRPIGGSRVSDRSAVRVCLGNPVRDRRASIGSAPEFCLAAVTARGRPARCRRRWFPTRAGRSGRAGRSARVRAAARARRRLAARPARCGPGSAARGEDRPGSDIDLLVDFDEDSSLFDLIRMSRELEALLGRAVGVVSVGGLKSRDQAILAESVDL